MFEKYTASYVNKNLWRLSRTCTHDDAMQEALIVFLDCAARYRDKVDNAAWFMSLYKRSLAGRIADLATADTRYRETGELLCDVQHDDATPLEAMGDDRNLGELTTAVRQAPSEVRAVLSLLMSAPSELLELMASSWTSRGHKEPFGNKMLCQLLGVEPGTDLLAKVRDYLT